MLKETKKKKVNMKYIFMINYEEQVEKRLKNLNLTTNYVDEFVKSIQDSTWTQDKYCYYVNLNKKQDTFLDLRANVLKLIHLRFMSKFKNLTIVQDNCSLIIYK